MIFTLLMLASAQTLTPPKVIVTDSNRQGQDIRQGDELTPISGIKKQPTQTETKTKRKKKSVR
jgi:hypothetical protein